jgi:hypothetical protein
MIPFQTATEEQIKVTAALVRYILKSFILVIIFVLRTPTTN